MVKKIFLLTLFMAGAFFTVNRAQTCTLDPEGTWQCIATVQDGVIIGYSCVEGSSQAKCKKPPKAVE